jgi:hypothetical protein
LRYYTRFAGDESYNASTGMGSLAVAQANVRLAVKNVAGVRGSQVTLTAVLKRQSDLAPLDGRAVTISANGTTYSATTDAAGKATVAHVIPPGTPRGTHAVSAAFAGDALHRAANGAGLLTVK